MFKGPLIAVPAAIHRDDGSLPQDISAWKAVCQVRESLLATDGYRSQFDISLIYCATPQKMTFMTHTNSPQGPGQRWLHIYVTYTAILSLSYSIISATSLKWNICRSQHFGLCAKQIHPRVLVKSIDICDLHSQTSLVVCDYFSNFIEVEHLQTTTFRDVCKALKVLFAFVIAIRPLTTTCHRCTHITILITHTHLLL